MTFTTEYPRVLCDQTRTSKFMSYIVARNEDEAKRFAYERNMGERIVSCGADYDKMSPAIEPTPAFFHWLVFVSHIATRAGYEPEQLLADDGIIHELVHGLNRIGGVCGYDDDVTTEAWANLVADYTKLLLKIGFGPPERADFPPKKTRAKEIDYQI